MANVTPWAGSATAPATRSPDCHSATCTAQSLRPSSENSRVPSSGSTIHTRSALNRTGLSTPSSESTASPGRSRASASIRKSWDRLSPAAFRSASVASASSSRTASSSSAGFGGQPRGDLVVAVVTHRRDSISSMTCCASSSRLRSGVSRRSGFFGRW